MIGDWKVLSTQVVFRHPRLTLVEDEVELPDGSRSTYLRQDDAGADAVTVICQRGDGKILVQHEYSHPPRKVMMQFPGGAVESGETPEQAVNRELQEESKFRAGSIQYLGKYYINNRRSSAVMHVLLVKDAESAALPADPGEVIESFWLSEQEIADLIRDGRIENYAMLAAWGLFRCMVR